MLKITLKKPWDLNRPAFYLKLLIQKLTREETGSGKHFHTELSVSEKYFYL